MPENFGENPEFPDNPSQEGEGFDLESGFDQINEDENSWTNAENFKEDDETLIMEDLGEAYKEGSAIDRADLYNPPEKSDQSKTIKSTQEEVKATLKGLWYKIIYNRALRNAPEMYHITSLIETADYVDELSRQNKKKIEQKRPWQHAVGSSWYKPPVWVNVATAPIRGWWYSTFSPNAVLKKIPGGNPGSYSEIANYIDWQRTKARRPDLIQSMQEISEKAATRYTEYHASEVRQIKRNQALFEKGENKKQQALIEKKIRQGVAEAEEKERLEKEAKEEAEKAEREIREKAQEEAKRQRLEEETKKKAKEAERKASIEDIQKTREEAEQQRLKKIERELWEKEKEGEGPKEEAKAEVTDQAPEEEFEAEKVEIWQMTKKEFDKAKIPNIFPHKQIVKKALYEDKPIPNKVLKEYPDLAKSYWESMGIDSEEIAKRLEKLSEMD